ncbi:MAG TPA: hypothetical protein VFV99_26065 [Kofleriaceae bacterium]|nr:hypothetical protein [Kofleriaceae bacterium]
MRWLACLLVACSAPQPPAASPAQPHAVPSNAKPEVREGDRKHVVDSHVHLAFYPVADKLAQHGVDAVVDLASPEWALGKKYPLLVIQSGPMLTRPRGYPLDSWGADGYGIGCGKSACVKQAIDRLVKQGARVIKIALDDKGLDPKLAQVAVSYAHSLNLKVAVHALTDASARVAADIHADVLAHTPVEPLSGDTVAAWKREAQTGLPAVLSTLAAFGGSDDAIGNLQRLRAAGVTVLYGTDLGNVRVDGPSQEEIALLKRAGLDDQAIETAMTTAPWDFWGFSGLVAVPAGKTTDSR